MDAPAQLFLPAPISTNNLFRNLQGAGRVRSTEYKAWLKEAQQLLAVQKSPKFTSPVFLSFIVGEKGVSSAMDSDNTLKAYIDVLKKAQVIVDDNRKWVRSVRATWHPELKGCIAIIGPATPPPFLSELNLTPFIKRML